MFGNKDKSKKLSKRGVAIRGMKAGKAIANALSPTGGSDTPEVDSGALYVDKGGDKYKDKYTPKPKEDPVAAPASLPNSSKVNSESGSNSAMSIGKKKKKSKATRY